MLAVKPVILKKSPEFVVDQFQSTEFFYDDGMEIRDYAVFAKSQADPVLREKMREYLVENDVKSLDPSIDDDAAFATIQSKYDSMSNILSRVKDRINELRSIPKVEEHSAS